MTTETVTLPTGAMTRLVSADPKGPATTILIIHGWKSHDPLRAEGSYEAVQKRFAELGFNSLLVCLRGHPSASGNIEMVTRQDHIDDIREATVWACSRPTVSGEFAGYGTSYGAYLLGIMAGEIPFSFIAFRAAALYPDRELSEPVSTLTSWDGLKEWRSVRHAPSESLALKGLARHIGPFALFTSTRDQFMPHQITESYLMAAAGAAHKAEFPMDAEHTLTEAEQTKFLEALTAWIQKITPEPSLS